MSFEFINKLKAELINIDNELYEDLEDVIEENIFSDETSIELLNFFSKSVFIRNASKDEIIDIFKRAFEKSPKEAIKILFYIRDKEEGLGERRAFRAIINYLGSFNSDALRENLFLIPYYGRWDDLYSLFNTKLEEDVVSIINDKLLEDIKSDNPSTLAKWLKSENTSSSQSRELGRKTRVLLKLTSKEYRKILSKLRKKLNLVECSMSNKDWENIQYGNITLNSIKKYKEAFLRHDTVRFKEYREMNRSFLVYRKILRDESLLSESFPYDLVEKLVNSEEMPSTYEFRDYIEKEEGDMLVSIGISQRNLLSNNSMGALCGGVGTALYLLSFNKGRYKDYIITMKPKPNFKKVIKKSLEEEVETIIKASLCNEINVEGALDLILFAAIKHDINKEEIPKRVLFITDASIKVSMLSRVNEKEVPYFINAEEFERIKDKWKMANLDIPELIFWAIDKKRENSTIFKYDDNFTFAFGYSNEVFVSILNGRNTSTKDLLNKILESDRYNKIK